MPRRTALVRKPPPTAPLDTLSPGAVEVVERQTADLEVLRQAAGLDFANRAMLLRKLKNVARKAMRARKVTRTYFQGVLVGEHVDIDWSIRLHAAEIIRDLIGANAPRQLAAPVVKERTLVVLRRDPEPRQRVDVIEMERNPLP